jgi:hypothetical protein
MKRIALAIVLAMFLSIDLCSTKGAVLTVRVVAKIQIYPQAG